MRHFCSGALAVLTTKIHVNKEKLGYLKSLSMKKPGVGSVMGRAFGAWMPQRNPKDGFMSFLL
jgi:hypothetical protein